MLLFTIYSVVSLLLEDGSPYNKYSLSRMLLPAAGGGVWVAVHPQLAGGPLRLQGSAAHCGGLHGLGDEVPTHSHGITACH